MKPKMLAICKCGHTFEEHDWGAYDKNEAECLVLDEKTDGKCPCKNFEMPAPPIIQENEASIKAMSRNSGEGIKE